MAPRTTKAGAIRRPMPPPSLMEAVEPRFEPAEEVRGWMEVELLTPSGCLYNPDHAHLMGSDMEVLWASEGFASKGRAVVGTAEQVAFRCGAWQRGRQEQQMREWFGRVPAFLITLDASYCAACSDAAFCALVEHELYHIAHALDEFQAPAFTKDGEPKLCIRGHDVEEFIGVVQRYGVGDPGGALARLAAAAKGVPTVRRVDIAGACGTCLLRVA